MKSKFLTWAWQLIALLLLLFGTLILVVLNPTLLYANKTNLENYTVFHNKPLDKELELRLRDARTILKGSQLYDAHLKFDVCLNDGSFYPSLLELFLGRAFALGFTSNKIVICGEASFKNNTVEVNGHKWNLTQLLAHEQTHCLVFHKIGFWRSNPVANNPTWKWEGYPEYIARRNTDQIDLAKNIQQLQEALKRDKNQWGLLFSGSTESPKEYVRFRLLNQYCLDIKNMTYENLLKDTTSEQTIRTEMMSWFAKQTTN